MADYEEKKSGDDINVQYANVTDHEKNGIHHNVPIYEDDPNLDPSAIGDFEEDSPYPEVRSAVANTDDPTMPCGTLRAWIIGLAWAILIPGLNQCAPSHMVYLL